ncbi:unnamed protein product [Ambrosiozyma monospora]|uniref:Unnamed protein product n=1 Tax=Ambrosiozyma monospora TaxID=43982 RepID=A0A9W7DLD0_AMBMO|nr:unnamed protein product [Ambrosiozyma monospora]
MFQTALVNSPQIAIFTELDLPGEDSTAYREVLEAMAAHDYHPHPASLAGKRVGIFFEETFFNGLTDFAANELVASLPVRSQPYVTDCQFWFDSQHYHLVGVYGSSIENGTQLNNLTQVLKKDFYDDLIKTLKETNLPDLIMAGDWNTAADEEANRCSSDSDWKHYVSEI